MAVWSAALAESPPLVGRVSEWERLTNIWRATERGRAQLVLVTGEAGIGKTRLVEQLRSWCARRGAAVAEARAYAAEGELAYGPVVAWLRSPAFEPHLRKLDRGSLSELARLLPELLVELRDVPRPDPLPENEQRARLFTALVKAILGAAEPLVLIADDLHWYDRETLHLVHHLLRVEPDAALLVAGTARREELGERHPLNDLLVGLRLLDRVTEIELARLSLQETAALGEQLSGRPLAAAGVDRLHAETEGNPLFVVEALRAGWDPRRGDRAWSSAKVQAVIEYRLAQLTEPARSLAGLAATIGREFTTDVLMQASKVDDETVVRSIDELWQRGIVRERGSNVYDFSHHRIREVAYANLSPARRRHEHWAVARALERIHTRGPRPVSGQIAAHYEQAGMTNEAIAWYETAAEAAQRLYAMTEAGRLLERALDIALTLPQSIEGEARELALLTMLLTPIASADGWASRRLAEVQQRALQLARSLCVDLPPQLLYSLALASLSRDDFDAARHYGEQLRARGQADGDDAVLLVESDYVLGIAAFWQGELEVARRHFEAAVAGHGPELRRAHLMRYWLDPQVICLSRLGNTLWFLGDPPAAVRARDDALALAENVNDPPSRATALVFAALLAVEMEDTGRLREYVALLESGSGEHEGRANRVAASLLQAFIRVLDGETKSGLTEMQSTLDDPSGTEHAPGMRAVIGRLFLAAHTAIGYPRGRLEAADRLLRMGGAARLWEAEAYRARAECLAELGAPSDAVEAELKCAIHVARQQGAHMLEQNATASLVRYGLAHRHGSEFPARC